MHLIHENKLNNWIRHITIKFANEINPSEVTLLRGAVNSALGQGHSCLFHNHVDDGYRYSYPLIQYKRINKKAAIVCLEKGADDVGQLFAIENPKIKLGERDISLKIETLIPGKTLVQLWNTTFEYNIRNWAPLNSKNYGAYHSQEALTDKIAMLEGILVGNLLSFLKGIGIRINGTIKAKITNIDDTHIVTYKGVKLMAFNINFISNLSLPNYIGIGKNASIGFGVITKRLNKLSDNETPT